MEKFRTLLCATILYGTLFAAQGEDFPNTFAYHGTPLLTGQGNPDYESWLQKTELHGARYHFQYPSDAAITALNPTQTFTDVPNTHWASKAIQTMTQQGYMSGYKDDQFKPEKPLTREEAAAIFSKMVGGASPIMLYSSFSDISSDRWSAAAIENVARKNIISGYGDKTYRPDQKMSRQEFTVIAHNYLHYVGYQTMDPTVLDDIAYSDQKFIAPWAQNAVRELAYLGFLAYNPKTLFNPEKYITRAEAAEISYRLTNTKEAVALHSYILQQRIENKAEQLLTALYPTEEDRFRHSAVYWQQHHLIIMLTDPKKAQALSETVRYNKDNEIVTYLRVGYSPRSQADFDIMERHALTRYAQLEPQGRILDITPDREGNFLVITVNTLSPASAVELHKDFAKEVRFILPEIKEAAAIKKSLPKPPKKEA